jgi:hypothetical protein
MLAISLALHPPSASRRQAALRSPCAEQRFGNSAASHHSRKEVSAVVGGAGGISCLIVVDRRCDGKNYL